MMVKSDQPGEDGGCTLQLRGQIHFPYFYSTPICTLWVKLKDSSTKSQTWKSLDYVSIFPFSFLSFPKSCEKKKKGKERKKERPLEIANLSAESIDMPFILLPFSHRSENLELAHLHFLLRRAVNTFFPFKG
jgi:hypothetical protein